MTSRYFEARWPGWCADCGEPFSVGEPIRYNDLDQIIGQDCCGHFYGGCPVCGENHPAGECGGPG